MTLIKLFFFCLAGEFLVPKQRSLNKVGHGEIVNHIFHAQSFGL